MPRLISIPPVGRWNKSKKKITLSSKTYESLHEVVAAAAAAAGKAKKEHNTDDVNDDETVVTRGRSSDDTAVLTSSDEDDHTLDDTTADGTLSSAPTRQPSDVRSKWNRLGIEKPTPAKTPPKVSLLETVGGVEMFSPDFWEHSAYIQGDKNNENDDLQLMPARVPTYTDEAMEILLANEEDAMSASSLASTDLLESPYPLVRDWTGPAGMRFWSLKRTRDSLVCADDPAGAPAHWATLPPRWTHSEMVEPEVKFVPVPAGTEDDIEMGFGFEVKRMKMHVEPLGFEVERVDL